MLRRAVLLRSCRPQQCLPDRKHLRGAELIGRAALFGLFQPLGVVEGALEEVVRNEGQGLDGHVVSFIMSPGIVLSESAPAVGGKRV